MRHPVTKPQLSGTRWQNNRVQKALVRRDTKDIETSFRGHAVSMSTGVAGMVLLCVIGFVVAKISPQSNQRDAKFIVTTSGGRYVQYGEAFHPILNLASARLVLGGTEPAKPVKDAVLDTRSRGQAMGIYGAPELLAPRDDQDAVWTVCDAHTDTLSLTAASSVTTTLIAGLHDPQGQKSLSSPNAVVVRDPDTTGQVWVLWGNRRATVHGGDKAAQEVLGLTPDVVGKAAPISHGLLHAITVSPPITAPFIPDRGQLSAAVPGMKVGDVVRSKTATGDSVFTVVYADGVQAVSAFVAELLAATGSTITTTSTGALVKAARVQRIDVDAFPPAAPVYAPAPVICWTWARGATDAVASTRLTVGDQLPLSTADAGRIVKLAPARGIEQADQTFTTPGKGWYVRVTGDARDSQALEQPLWIDDTGVRYFIGLDGKSYDGTVEALGINQHSPLLIPWDIAKLYAQGVTLSKSAALTYHEEAPVDLGQRAAPKPVKR